MRTLSNSLDADATVVDLSLSHSSVELQDLSYAVGDPAHAECEDVARRSPVTSAMRVVGVLAFGQSLLFLVIWLIICASAGAATPPKKVDFNPTLVASTYQPAKQRSPFTKVASSSEAVLSVANKNAFQLEGILYSTSNPSAIVNGQLMTLNKIVTLELNGAKVPVRAVAITRDKVTLEATGKKFELQMKDEVIPAKP